MSSTYSKFLAEASYKHTLGKPNTDSHNAWYEEYGRVAHRVEIDAIWLDSLYIPLVAPEVDEKGFYYTEVGTIKSKILQKCENIALDKVPNTKATYYSPFLIDAIIPSYGEGYEAILTDWNDEVIPFGLNQWVIDPDLGYLSFMEGWPDGYQERPKITFFKYVGRKADEAMLLSSGVTAMESEYEPKRNEDIATKGYVDSVTNTVTTNIRNLIPVLPPTVQDVDLVLDNYTDASPYNSEQIMPVLFYEEDWKLRIPMFYHPGKGQFSIFINNHELLSCDLASITGPEVKSNIWYIESIVDPYATDKVANNFYKSIVSYIHISDDVISQYVTAKIPYVTIQVQQYYNFEYYSSNPITIGFDKRIKDPSLTKFTINKAKNDAGIIKYISGVPSIAENTTFNFGFSVADIIYFKKNNIASYTIDGITEEPVYEPVLDYYSNYGPTHKVLDEITVPENSYQENLQIKACGYNIEEIENICASRKYPIRIDTVSDESERIVSPTVLDDNFEIKKWTEYKAMESLKRSNELQMLNGSYKWPRGDYSDNGNVEIFNVQDEIYIDVPAGPNYDDPTVIDENGTRYVTFMFDMPISSGFYINLRNPKNIETNSNTKAYKLPVFRCKVLGKTGWLNMNIPYEGVLAPREDNEGCIVPNLSNTDKKYITFGNEPLDGTLVITIGIQKSDIEFDGIDVIFNN